MTTAVRYGVPNDEAPFNQRAIRGRNAGERTPAGEEEARPVLGSLKGKPVGVLTPSARHEFSCYPAGSYGHSVAESSLAGRETIALDQQPNE
jgi:hypothetical protein